MRFERFGDMVNQDKKTQKVFLPSHSIKSSVNGQSGIDVSIDNIKRDFIHILQKENNCVRYFLR